MGGGWPHRSWCIGTNWHQPPPSLPPSRFRLWRGRPVLCGTRMCVGWPRCQGGATAATVGRRALTGFTCDKKPLLRCSAPSTRSPPLAMYCAYSTAGVAICPTGMHDPAVLPTWKSETAASGALGRLGWWKSTVARASVQRSAAPHGPCARRRRHNTPPPPPAPPHSHSNPKSPTGSTENCVMGQVAGEAGGEGQMVQSRYAHERTERGAVGRPAHAARPGRPVGHQAQGAGRLCRGRPGRGLDCTLTAVPARRGAGGCGSSGLCPPGARAVGRSEDPRLPTSASADQRGRDVHEVL